MKRMNKKGFTLIELLAVIIIMGVLLLIAVPSVSKYIEQSRKDTYITNLVKYADVVKTEVNSYATGYTFGPEQFLVVPITCLDLESGSANKSPFGEYVKEKSYIVVTRKVDGSGNVNGFEYKVAALDTTGFGTVLSPADSESINIVSNPTIVEITGAKGSYAVGDGVATGTAVIPSFCDIGTLSAAS